MISKRETLLVSISLVVGIIIGSICMTHWENDQIRRVFVTEREYLLRMVSAAQLDIELGDTGGALNVLNIMFDQTHIQKEYEQYPIDWVQKKHVNEVNVIKEFFIDSKPELQN